MSIIARCNGTVLVEEGERLGVVEQGGGWLGSAVFVAALALGLLLVNGVIQLLLHNAVGAWLCGASALCGLALRGLLRRKRALALSTPTQAPWLVFDLGARALFDRAGNRLARFNELRVERASQATSSSKALRVALPGASLVIARGNPFGDSVDDFEVALRARGVITREA